METAVLTAELLNETAEALLDNVGRVDLDTVATVNEELEATANAIKTVVQPNHKRTGFRQIGTRKLGKINALAKTIARLQNKGINTDYILKKFTKWRGPVRTNQKEITGIISQLKEFENA